MAHLFGTHAAARGRRKLFTDIRVCWSSVGLKQGQFLCGDQGSEPGAAGKAVSRPAGGTINTKLHGSEPILTARGKCDCASALMRCLRG